MGASWRHLVSPVEACVQQVRQRGLDDTRGLSGKMLVRRCPRGHPAHDREASDRVHMPVVRDAVSSKDVLVVYGSPSGFPQQGKSVFCGFGYDCLCSAY